MSGLHIIADRNMRGVERAFAGLGDVTLCDGRSLSRRDLVAADVLLVRSVTEVNEQLLSQTPVRFVGTATAGTDHVDQAYLGRQGIAFASAPGANANSVVEYVLAAIAASDDHLERLFAGGSVGVVGYGHVGHLLCARLSALGIAHRVYDPWLDGDRLPQPATLEEVLASDVISLHAELTRAMPWPSYHLLGSTQLAQIEADCLLINACRGPVIDNSALLRQLESRGAPQTVLDVWEGEPAISAELLQRVQVGTAHIAGYSLDSKLLATGMLASAMAGAFDLEPPPDLLDDLPRQTLQPPPSLRGASLLRWLLGQNYDIAIDDAALRAVASDRLTGSLAQGFDQLRREYRERRELRGTNVELEGVGHEQRELVLALDCKPIAREAAGS